MKENLRIVVFSLASAVCIAVLLQLQPAKIMEGYDLARMHFFYKSDFRAAILAGEIPWWNPYTALGRPFLADIETATLYPPNWLVLPFGVTAGIWMMIVLHLALAIEGMRHWAQRLGISRILAFAAGLSFALSGALLGRLQAGQLQVFCVICLWPWICLSGIKLQDKDGVRPVVIMAFWLAWSFLAGSPQILWCGLIVIGVFLTARASSIRSLFILSRRLIAAGALAVGITAIQFFPFVELVNQGNRPLHQLGFATIGGESGLDWLTLLVSPSAWLPTNGEFNLFGGGIFFVIACAAFVPAIKNRDGRGLLAAALAGFVLALGNRTAILPGLAHWVPGFSSVRYPSRYALASIMMVNVLAIGLLNKLQRWKKIGHPLVFFALIAQGGVLILGLFVQASNYRAPQIPKNGPQLKRDLRSEGLPRDGAPPRVALPVSILVADAGATVGVSTVSGFNNPALGRTWNALYTLLDQPAPDFHRAEVKDDIISKLNQRPDYFGLSAVLKLPGNRIYFSSPPAPRAFVCFSVTRVSGAMDAVLKIRQGHDFIHDALVEQTLSFQKNIQSTPTGRAEIVEFSRNRVVVKYSAAAPALLVLEEAWYPGWTATIDNLASIETMPVNGWMRGVPVPAGAAQVIFNYRPTRWWLYVLVSLFTILLALHLWTRPKAIRANAITV